MQKLNGYVITKSEAQILMCRKTRYGAVPEMERPRCTAIRRINFVYTGDPTWAVFGINTVKPVNSKK